MAVPKQIDPWIVRKLPDEIKGGGKLARALGVTRQVMELWVKKWGLPHGPGKTLGKMVFKREDVAQWLHNTGRLAPLDREI